MRICIRRPPRKWALALAILLVVILAAGGCIWFLTDIRSDIGYGIWDRWLAPRSPVALTAASLDQDDRQIYSLEEIRMGKVNGITYSHSLWLINQDYPLDTAADRELEAISEEELLFYKKGTQKLLEMLNAASAATGDRVYIMSTYRTQEEQEQLYKDDPVTAGKPGCSEHQAGLAADLYTYQHAGRRFIDSDGGRWIQENAWQYGFIIRYPYGKSGITGCIYEPWHVRYVGEPHAKILYSNRWTMEEYIQHLRSGQAYMADGYMILYQIPTDGTVSIPSELTEVTVSPDNTGGFIVTGRIPG